MNKTIFAAAALLTFTFALGQAQPTGPAFKVPQVGQPYFTKDQYKPIPGKYGGKIVRATLGEPKSFNPIVASETSTTDFTQRIFQGLTDEDVFTGGIKPALAESWEVAPDGVTWTFKLRKDVTFNDGTPFTARDVVFTWNDLIYDLNRPPNTEPRWPCSMRDIVTFDGKIVKVEAIDDYTVRFVTPVKVAIFDEIVGAPNLMSEKKYAPLVANGTFGSALGADAAPEDIVGTGPFMLGKYVRGERVILKRNPNFWRKDSAGQRLPYLDEMVFIVTRDINAMLLNFQQGIIDSYALQSGKDVGELRPKQKQGNFTLYQLGPDAGTDFICFNMNLDAAKEGKIPDYKVKWFRDSRFRLAISYAIDRGAIVRNVLRQLGYPQAAPFTLSSGWFTNYDIKPHPYDPAKAKALLADMGIKDRDGDGILEDEQGNKIKFTINTNAGNNVREETANFIVTDLKKIGMDVNQLFLEFNLLVDKINTRHDWECLVFALTGTPEPHWGANIWKSTGRLHLWWPSEKEPSFPWEKRIDEIFNQGIQELDKEKRRALYREWVEIVYREEPMVYTAMQERVVAVRNKFGNFFPSSHPTRFAAWHNEEEIFVLDSARQ